MTFCQNMCLPRFPTIGAAILFHIATCKSNNEKNYYSHPEECQERMMILMELQSVSLIWSHYENICIKKHIKVDFV